jgi:hypothetical protein
MSQSHLAACPCCARHVRVSEPTCPFCRSALGHAFRATPARQAPRKRLPRAALFALGTAGAVPACSSLPRDAQVGNADSATSDNRGATEDASQVLQGAAYGAPAPCESDFNSPQCGMPAYGGGPCADDPTECGFPVPEPGDGSSEAATDGATHDAGDATSSDAESDASTDAADDASTDAADADLSVVILDAAYGVPPDAF